MRGILSTPSAGKIKNEDVTVEFELSTLTFCIVSCIGERCIWKEVITTYQPSKMNETLSDD